MTLSSLSLPNEVEQLRDRLNAQIAQLADKDEQLASKDAKIAQLESLLREALQRPFSPSSEKLSAEQARLFDEGDDEPEGAASDEPVPVAGYQRQQQRRPRIPPELPRAEVIHDLLDEDKVCAEHGCALTPMGEVVSEQLEFVPAKVQVLKHIRKKYACPYCEGHMVTAPKPADLLPKSIATPGLLSWVAVSKFADALPLYRQGLIFKRLGVELDRTTLANWMIACGQRVQPLVNLLWDKLREQPVIHMDETTVQVLDEPGKAASSKSYMWVSVAGPPDQGIVLFHYEPSRSGKVPVKLLTDYQGALMADGYEGYGRVCQTNPITRLGCWAHARHKFMAAKRQQPKGKTGAADQALAWIGKLYRIERAIKDCSEVERAQQRQAQAQPILAKLKEWLDKRLRRTAPKTAMGKALTYLSNQWGHLARYTEHGAYPIDNNRAENAIRPFVIGRKNYLFSQSVRGVRANANLYTLIETAKAHGLDPHQYLLTVFERLPQADTVDKIEALLPHRVKGVD